jgi:zinc and cadmium transporter
MNNFIWSLGASILVSLISLVGIFTFLFKDKFIDTILFLLIGFSAGALIAGAFLHLIPEALESSSNNFVFTLVILGFIFFFIMEKYFHWRHCHKGICDIHAFTYLNLIGDGIHNFTDGLVIGASFLISIHFGIITTLVITLHEIPQEMGDFGVLVYGGFNKFKALYFNFITALTCVLGTIVGYLVSDNIRNFSLFLMPLTAGGFIYIAACDLIPELHKQSDLKRTALSMLAFICGVSFILLARLLDAH